MNTLSRLTKLEKRLHAGKDTDLSNLVVVLSQGTDGKYYRDDGSEWTEEMEREHGRNLLKVVVTDYKEEPCTAR